LIDPVRIPEVAVDATISDGQLVYKRRSDNIQTSPT